MTTDYQRSGTPAKRGFSGTLQVRQLERKEEIKAYPPDDERFVKLQTSVKDWPVFSDQAVFVRAVLLTQMNTDAVGRPQTFVYSDTLLSAGATLETCVLR